MLQIKNTLGGGKPEGLYVWSKSSSKICATNIKAVTGVSFDINVNIKIPLVSSNPNMPLSDITPKDLIGLEIQINNDSDSYNPTYIKITSETELTRKTGSSSSSTGTYTYDASTGIISTNQQGYVSGMLLKYTNTVYATKESDLLGIVVDENESAYPIDGYHTDGYYYRRVSFATGTLTRGVIATPFEIEHNLGVVPQMFFAVSNDAVNGNFDCNIFWYLGTETSGAYYANSIGYKRSNSSYANITNGFTIDETKLSISTEIYCIKGTWRWFAVGGGIFI